MSGRQEDEDEVWRSSWETDDEVDPPGAPGPRQPVVGPGLRGRCGAHGCRRAQPSAAGGGQGPVAARHGEVPAAEGPGSHLAGRRSSQRGVWQQALDVTPAAALGLLRQLIEVGIVREATGRASLAGV